MIGWLRGAGEGTLAFLWDHRAAVCIAVLAWAAWHFAGLASERADALDRQAAGFAAAQDAATQQERDRIAGREAQWRMNAQVEQTKHEAELDKIRRAADAYIAAHSVRPEGDRGAAGQVAATSTNDGAALPQGLPASGVVVSGSDVRTCSEVTKYALDARAVVLRMVADLGGEPPAQ